jgi:hypothetical protein
VVTHSEIVCDFQSRASVTFLCFHFLNVGNEKVPSENMEGRDQFGDGGRVVSVLN